MNDGGEGTTATGRAVPKQSVRAVNTVGGATVQTAITAMLWPKQETDGHRHQRWLMTFQHVQPL